MAQGTLNAVQTLRATIGFDVYTKPEVDALLEEKADKTDTYTKAETNSLLDDKADKSTTYTKTEVDNALSLKANSADVYTKTEADNLLSNKADKSTTLAGYGITDAYTQTQTDNLLNGKANADDVYTKTEIDTKIPNTVGSATKPVYVNGGVVSACTYELNKTVPANAVFTDTTYTAGNGLNLSGTSFSAKAGTNVTVDSSGINVNGNGAVASADSGLISGGTAYTELRPTLDGTWVKNAQTTAINLQKLEGGIEYLYGLLSHQYDQLKKYINGNYYDYDTDADSKYTKTVPSGAMPYASLEQIGGRTLVWNQLNNNNRTTATILDIAFTNNADGSWTINGTSSGAGNCPFGKVSVIAGHKYFLKGCPAGGGTSTYWLNLSGSFGNDRGNGSIITMSTSYATLYVRMDFKSGVAFNNVTIFPQLFDLTLMYGAGNEPTTVAEFTAQFPAQYYQYSQGQLISAGVTEVVSKGKNLCDGKAYKGVVGNNILFLTSTTEVTSPFTTNAGYQGVTFIANVQKGKTYIFSTDATGQSGSAQYLWAVYSTLSDTVSNANKLDYGKTYNSFTPTESGIVLVMYSVANGTSVSWTFAQIEEGSTRTSYTPYNAHTYPIPASIQALTGYGWSAGSVYNYIDYERKVFVQNVGAVDLGTLTWSVDATNYRILTGGIRTSVTYPADDNHVANIVCADFFATYSKDITSNHNAGISVGSTGTLSIGIASNDSTALNNLIATLSGKYLYYELATPQEIDISAYLTDDNLISVESGGTLTFPNSNGDDYRIPVPSAETYMIDLQSAL